MASSEATMKAYYAARAGEYDAVYEKPERQADIGWLQAWLPLHFKGARVLDVAAGTGFWTKAFAATAEEVILVDASHETLAVAQSRLPDVAARYVVGDAYDLPEELGTFTASFIGFWYSHIPIAGRRSFLTGLCRCLEPGATVVLIDNRYVQGSNHPITEADVEGNTYQTRRLRDGSVHRVLKNFPSEEELRRDLDGVLAVTEYHELQYYWALAGRTPSAGPGPSSA